MTPSSLIRRFAETREARRERHLRSRARRLALDVLSSASPGEPEEDAIRFPFYHHVFDDERHGFEEQLRAFKSWGRCVRLSEALEMLGRGRFEGRCFCITFDDGFANLYHNAAPILERLEVPAAFFLPTDAMSVGIDRPGHPVFRRQEDYPRIVEFLDWNMCRELAGRGFELGSHTCSHADLTRCSEDELRHEILDSRRRIEEEIGPCRFFSCTWGTPSHYTSKIVGQVRDAGYECFLTTTRGPTRPGDSPFDIGRDHLAPLWPVRHVGYFMSRRGRGSG